MVKTLISIYNNLRASHLDLKTFRYWCECCSSL